MDSTFALPARSRIPAVVLRAQRVSPGIQRLTLGGPDVADWLALDGVAAPTAWVKVFPPGREGRAYTILDIDRRRGTCTLDFVLHDGEHDGGGVAGWALHARPGDELEIAGPRGGAFALATDTQWLWIGADASALPAVQRILDALPAAVRVHGVLAMHDARDRPALRGHRHALLWADTRPEPPYASPLATGPGQAWIAGEAAWVGRWKDWWQGRLDTSRVHAKGYWREGGPL
jgi:NADPH-dependent ferric siderophore reductase